LGQPMKPTKLWLALGAIAATAALVYGYIFVAGAPQFDPPTVESSQQMAAEGLNFQLATFQSQAMGTARTYGVILPPGYDRQPDRRYPVIVLLHGGHDDARAYVDKYGIATILKNLYAQQKLPPAILITPDGNDLRGSSPLWDPQYFDGENGKVGTLIGAELVQVIQSRYRTLKEPKFWAIGGISSGGWGALNIGLRHLDNFRTFFSHSGYFTDSSGSQNSPNEFIKALPPEFLKGIHIYLDAGKNDTDLLESTQAFRQTLAALKVNHVFFAFPGGHGLSGADIGWNYFHKHLSDSLSYVGEQFKKSGVPSI
jgi:enterochelin esterase-like enzyme